MPLVASCHMRYYTGVPIWCQEAPFSVLIRAIFALGAASDDEGSSGCLLIPALDSGTSKTQPLHCIYCLFVEVIESGVGCFDVQLTDITIILTTYHLFLLSITLYKPRVELGGVALRYINATLFNRPRKRSLYRSYLLFSR